VWKKASEGVGKEERRTSETGGEEGDDGVE
jgi:hypothetical protein